MLKPKANTPSFLHQLTKVLLTDHGAELQNVAVVLPNQRASLFLRNELVKQAGKALWSPPVFTMDKFVTALTKWQIPDKTELLLELYKVYLTLPLQQHDPFYDFVGWGSIALKHFGEVDANLIDRDHFYNDITSFEEIEAWSLRHEPLSEKQAIMVARWHMHGDLHRAFDQHLSKHKLGFTGLVERRAVEQLREGSADIPWRSVWFAGLNALTAAESKIIDLFDAAGKAKLAWEADEHFVKDRTHAAGKVIRKHLKKWGSGMIEMGDALRSNERQVQIGTVPSKIGALRYVVQHLKSLTSEEIKRTTIVLTDAQLITPLLEALPSSIGAVNVTMSVPLTKIPLTGALTQCLMINSKALENDKLPINLLIDLLKNPVVSPLLKDDVFNELVKTWHDQGLTMVQVETIKTVFTNDLGAIGKELSMLLHSTDAEEVVLILQRLIDLVKDEAGTLVNEQAYQLAKTVKSLKRVIETLPAHERNSRNVLKMWHKLVAHTSMGLYGEPLQGLQVMGLLETRAIPLEHVIMLPANEGHLPPSSFERGFIPFDVRRAFGLPMRSDTDAVIAYHFYRALANCSSMLLLVDSSTSTEVNTPTRFIDQLKLELNNSRNPTIRTSIQESLIQAPTPERAHPIYSVTKTPAIIAQIKKAIAKNLSPSAINSYLTCPLDFYYKYVLELKEQITPEFDIQMNTIGNIVHNVIEQCYLPSNKMDVAHINTFMAELDQHFTNAVVKKEAAGFLDHSRNKFPLYMAQESIRTLLQHEKEFLTQDEDLTVQHVETYIGHESTTSTGIRFKVGGIVDRVEVRNGVLSIIDLKTGNVDPKSLHVNGLTLENLKDKGKAIQLLAYAWAYINSNSHINEVRAAILSARKASTFPGIPVQVNKEPTIKRSQLSEIDRLFEEIITKMLDPNEPFKHNEHATYCPFCITQKAEKEAKASFS